MAEMIKDIPIEKLEIKQDGAEVTIKIIKYNSGIVNLHITDNETTLWRKSWNIEADIDLNPSQAIDLANFLLVTR